MKVKIVATKLEAQVKQVVKDGNFREDCLGKMRPTLMHHYVGVAFEMEAKERIAGRFKGQVSKEALPSLCSELFEWAAGLVSALDIAAIERHHFDRIVEHCAAAHNVGKAPAKVKTITEEPVMSRVFATEYLRHPAPITIGQAVGL